MKKSVKIRKIIFEILYEIHQKSMNFEESFSNFTKNISLNEQEKAMVYNIVLNSMRYNFFVHKILNKYLKKRTSFKIKTLLLTAVTQIVFLDFKIYAVTNDTVEVAKIKKLNPGLVNALLKNIGSNNELINKEEFDLSSIPSWFIDKTKKDKFFLKDFVKSISREPSLHLVFKDEKYLKEFNEDIIKTTEKSGFLNNKSKIKEINNYNKGHWWVQDLSSMLPIYLSPEFREKNIIDICSAPGGKAFQVLSLENEVTLNDISKKRINILKENLNRLRFNNKISHIDALNINEEKLYDIVILDSPCSGIGTIRRNPEIMFKKNPPNFNKLISIQENLIQKASKLLKTRGILIYMVCSFFYGETKAIKKKFLSENKNFTQYKFTVNKKIELNKFIDEDGDFYTIPKKFSNHMIDGFYAVKFIRNG